MESLIFCNNIIDKSGVNVMSYTNPEGQPQGFPYYFTNKLREALISELIAINGYEYHLANSDMPEVNMVLKHIISDEKKHFGEFLNMLRKYDPDQYMEYQSHVNNTFPITPMQKYEPNYNKQLILNNIREDIKGEFEAVILYEQIILEIPYQDIKEMLIQIIKVEKEHSEHLTKLLIALDSDKYNELS